MIDINFLRQKVLSSDLEQSVTGIDQSIKIVDEISDILLEGIRLSNNRFVSTEKISLFFSDYLKKLKNYIKGSDYDMSFWAAGLLMHYNINDSDAERILLDAIKFEVYERANIAIVILFRIKNNKVKDAVSERLNNGQLGKMEKTFLEEILTDISW